MRNIFDITVEWIEWIEAYQCDPASLHRLFVRLGYPQFCGRGVAMCCNMFGTSATPLWAVQNI